VGYDISARLNFYASGGITRGQYKSDQSVLQGPVLIEGANQTSVTGTSVIDGVDTIYQFSAHLSYQINRHNWLDAGYAYTTVSSALRPEFSQNSYNVNWRVTF